MTGRTKSSVKIQLESARALFANTVADPDPIPLADFPFTPLQLKQRQTAIYNALVKGKYSSINCESLLDKFGKISTDRQRTLTALRSFGHKIPNLNTQRLFDYFRFLSDGVYTKRKRSEYDNYPDMRCVICKQPNTSDCIQHYIGFGCEICTQVHSAAQSLQIPLDSIDLNEDMILNKKIVLFISSVCKASIDFKDTTIPDQNGRHIKTWYNVFSNSNQAKPRPVKLRFQRDGHAYHGYHAASKSFIPFERKEIINGKASYYFKEYFISEKLLLKHTSTIHIVLGAHSCKDGDALQGWYSFIVLGAQFIPLEFRGICDTDDADLHITKCYALHAALKYIERKRNLFRNKTVSIFTDNEVLVRVVNLQRKKSKRENYWIMEHVTQTLFDKTRNTIHEKLELGHHYSFTLPWVNMANKIAKVQGPRPRRPWVPLIPASFATLRNELPQ